MDVGSSRSAANVVGLVQGALKSLVIDLAVLLEGHCTVSRPGNLFDSSHLSCIILAEDCMSPSLLEESCAAEQAPQLLAAGRRLTH